MTHIVKGLVFYPEEHRYEYQHNELRGITGIIKQYIFPDKYKGVSEATLEQAKQRGSMIHEEIESYYWAIRTGNPPAYTSAVERFHTMLRPTMLKVFDNEVTVTDFKHFATNIDLVLHDTEGGVILGDIKTTYEYDDLYLRWQLSICAWMYEQCFNIPVVGLVGVWMPTKGEGGVRDVERLPDEEVLALLEAAANDCDNFETEFKPMQESILPSDFETIVDRLRAIDAQMRFLNETKTELMNELSGVFLAGKDKAWIGEGVRISRVSGGTRTTFDSKRFLEDHKELADLAGEYFKVTTTADTIRIKFE
jgi:hypothetical protein